MQSTCNKKILNFHPFPNFFLVPNQPDWDKDHEPWK